MSDLISRQDAIEALTVEYMAVGILGEQWAVSQCIDAIKQLPSARPKGAWIPCSERLPSKYGKYLVTVTRGTVDVVYYEKPIDMPWFYYYDSEENIEADAVAWMPLPEPYEGGDADV